LIVGADACSNELAASFKKSITDRPRSCSVSRGGLYNGTLDKNAVYEKNITRSLTDYSTIGNFGGNFSGQALQSDLYLGYTFNTGNDSISAPFFEFLDQNYTWLGLLGLDPKPANYTQLDKTNIEKNQVFFGV